MTYEKVHRRVTQGLSKLRGMPAALSSGTMPVPLLLRPGGLRETWLRLRGARHLWILLPGAAALVIVYVFQGFSGASRVPTMTLGQQAPPQNESYLAPAAPTALPAVTAAPLPVAPPSAPFGVAGAGLLTASGIPEAARLAYQRAAAAMATNDPACGVNWSVLAGLGRVESNHGRFAGSSIGADGLVTPPILGIRLDGSRPGTARISDSDGGRYDGDAVVDRAVGPMQFLPGTWKIYGADGNPQDMDAAAAAAARYLCAGNGDLRTRQGRWAAVYRYNHSDSYVSLVLSLADSYATGSPVAFPSRPSGTTTTDGEAATPAGQPAAIPRPVVSRPIAAPSEVTTPSSSAPTTRTSTTSTAAPAPSAVGSVTTTSPPGTTTPPATVPAPTTPVVAAPSVTPTASPVVG